jgi:hypothetical protein
MFSSLPFDDSCPVDDQQLINPAAVFVSSEHRSNKIVVFVSEPNFASIYDTVAVFE